MRMKRRLTILLSIAACGSPLLRAAAQTEAPLLGRWEGTTKVLSLELPMAVEFSPGSGSLEARIDIQGVTGLALSSVRFEDPQVHFELNAGPGLAVWDGRLHDGLIEGKFTQAGVAGEFTLNRPGEKPGDGTGEKDEVPKPFREEEVTFHNGEVKLAGTLTLPLSGGPFAAAVMISGSGPQNRDEELVGFRPFRLIAEHLGSQGVAVLRYDDRGVGGSTGSTMQSTTADFAADVESAVSFLSARSDIDGSRIGLIGHSEGAIVAPLVGSRDSQIAFMVLLAGTSVPGEKILLVQGERIVRANGATEELVQANKQTQMEIFEAVRTQQGWEEVEQSIRKQLKDGLEKMPAQSRSNITDLEAYLDSAVNGQLSFSRSPWFRYFLDFDPALALEKVSCPVLALFGEKDLQVPPDVNLPPMQEALQRAGNGDATLQVIAGANHLFQKAVSGSPNEYPQLEKAFVPGLLEQLSSWILQRVK